MQAGPPLSLERSGLPPRTKGIFPLYGHPETFSGHAELIWRKLQNATQQEVADDLGWSRQQVSHYSRLQNIAEEAWSIVATAVRANIMLRQEDGVAKNATDVAFTEYLLRNIVRLTGEQQHEPACAWGYRYGERSQQPLRGSFVDVVLRGVAVPKGAFADAKGGAVVRGTSASASAGAGVFLWFGL